MILFNQFFFKHNTKNNQEITDSKTKIIRKTLAQMESFVFKAKNMCYIHVLKRSVSHSLSE